jgi:hypothetical protein
VLRKTHQKISSGETLFQPLPTVYKSLLNILLFVGVFVFVSICNYVKRVAVAHASDNIFSPRPLSSGKRNPCLINASSDTSSVPSCRHVRIQGTLTSDRRPGHTTGTGDALLSQLHVYRRIKLPSRGLFYS